MLNEKQFSRGILAAFASVALVFVGATIVADWRTLTIDRETQALLGDALPSMERLAAVNDAVRDIEAFADDYPDIPSADRAAARARVEGLWRTIDAELALYQTLPVFEGELEMYSEVPTYLRAFDASVRGVVDQVERGEIAEARADADAVVRPKANRVTHQVRQLVRLNATNAVDSANRIDHTRHATVALSVVLTALAVLLTIGTASWVFLLFRSHSRLLHAHASLEEKRADELEVFGRRVAHDLLSPLSSLTFCLSAFRKAGEQDPKLAHALVRARQCVQRAQELVDNVFDFARSGGAPSPSARVEVREAVDQAIEEARAMAAAEGAVVEVEALVDCTVCCTQGVLGSLLGNLLRNAVKYMRDSVERRVTVRVTEQGGLVRFEVADTGPGIPGDIEETLFQPYVRGEGVTQPGLGLGLATVKRFCEAYGGTVGARSTPGRGAVFHFTLPRATAPAATAAGSGPLDAPGASPASPVVRDVS
jgi:signal transduction histidine kinase